MPKRSDENRLAISKTEPRRILAGFGGLADEMETIEAALALAQAFHAKISGYFVEESNLLDLAGLPFAQAIRTPGSPATPIEASQMEQELARAAATCRRTLVARAERSRISCTFQTTRGEYCSEIAKATVASDIVIINPANVAQQGRAGPRIILDRMGPFAGLVLLPERRRAASRGPVILLVETEADIATYRLADRIAGAADKDLVVVATPKTGRDDADLRNELSRTYGTDTPIEIAASASVSDIIASVLSLNPSFIVRPGGEASQDDLAEPLLQTTRAPLLLLQRSA